MKLPGHPVRTGTPALPGKEISFLLCPLTPPGGACGALAGQYLPSPSMKIDFFTPSGGLGGSRKVCIRELVYFLVVIHRDGEGH
jgi:hypothetical protein